MNPQALEAMRDINGYLYNLLSELVRYVESFPEDRQEQALNDAIERIVQDVQSWKRIALFGDKMSSYGSQRTRLWTADKVFEKKNRNTERRIKNRDETK